MSRRSRILTETVAGLTPVLLMFSVFLTFRGHNAPGGGFAGGLVMGAAVVLRYLAAGAEGVRSVRIDPIALMGVGLALALGVALAPLVVGDALLESAIWTFDVPLVGHIKLVSSSLFDIGVHILVVGAVTTVLVAFVEADDHLDGTGLVPDDSRLDGDDPHGGRP